jgi:hypothetical protein
MKHSLKLIAALVAISLCRQTSAAIFNINDGDVAALITAINTSNTNGEDDTIELATNGTYTLTTVNNTSGNGANGLPVILSDTGHTLVIHGNGATLQRSAAGGTPAFRIFQICAGADVTIDRLTIMNGIGSTGLGGGIFNDGFTGNATLTITNSTVSGNSASGAGGGIYNGQATLIINNSTVSGNSTGPNPGGFGGGGILNIVFSTSATLTINNSTISGNSAMTVGGGIRNLSIGTTSATLTIKNSTLSGNSAGLGLGGGIDNSAPSGSATLTIGDTILKTGASGANIRNFLGTVTSLGYNLSNDDASAFLNQTGDQNSTDPLLGPLQDNGGPTFTHALLTGSPAIDKGFNFSGSTTDQRGPGFVRTFDNPSIPNATGGDGTDIGSFEVQTLPPCPLGQGNWKNNPSAWPVSSLTLGSQTYTKTELLMILNTPIGTGKHADASLILADQLIAAKLNIANGSDPTPVSSTITNADSLLSGFSGKLPYHVRPSSATGQAMVNDASVLNNYNNGALTSGCTP